MIDYEEVLAEVKSRVGLTHAKTANDDGKLCTAIGDAIEFVSQELLRTGFVFSYAFTTEANKTVYQIPVQYSTRDLYINGEKMTQESDWVLHTETQGNEDKFIISAESITVPADTGVKAILIEYRGVPPLPKHGDKTTYRINLPRNYKKTLVPRAAYYAFLNNRMQKEADQQLGNFDRELPSVAGAFINPDEKRIKRV